MVIAAATPAIADLAAGSLVTRARAGAGLGIGRYAAQQLARRELARSIYQAPLQVRIARFLGRQLARFFNLINVSVPGGWWALVVLVVAVILVAAVVLMQIRPARSGRRASAAIQAGRELSARDHRELAERSAADGDYSTAVIELVRAIAAELEERDILPANPGRTADELAAEAGRALPTQATGLADVARLFDDIRYGERTGTRAAYQQVRSLDGTLRTARPAATAAPVAARAAL